MALEAIDLRFPIWIGRYQKTSRSWASAGWHRQATAIAVRAKAPGGFTKCQDSTLSV